MFEEKGDDQGRADGQIDARLNRPRCPRPDLFWARLSSRYRDAYLLAYKVHYDSERWQNEESQAYELAAKSHLVAGESVPQDRMFERGWRDGFDGKDTPPEGLSHDQLKTFERGHFRGRQLRR